MLFDAIQQQLKRQMCSSCRSAWWLAGLQLWSMLSHAFSCEDRLNGMAVSIGRVKQQRVYSQCGKLCDDAHAHMQLNTAVCIERSRYMCVCVVALS